MCSVFGIAARLIIQAPFDGTNKLDLYHKSRKTLTYAVERVPSGIIVQPGSVVLEAWWRLRIFGGGDLVDHDLMDDGPPVKFTEDPVNTVWDSNSCWVISAARLY